MLALLAILNDLFPSNFRIFHLAFSVPLSLTDSVHGVFPFGFWGFEFSIRRRIEIKGKIQTKNGKTKCIYRRCCCFCARKRRFVFVRAFWRFFRSLHLLAFESSSSSAAMHKHEAFSLRFFSLSRLVRFGFSPRAPFFGHRVFARRIRRKSALALAFCAVFAFGCVNTILNVFVYGHFSRSRIHFS